MQTKRLYERYTDIMPTGAGALFFIQMFSTLAFSILYSTLVLYITNQLKINDHLATSITASFIAFNYGLHVLGGYVGGRFFSYRGLFLFGMILQVLGCLMLAMPNTTALYWALAFFLAGAGLNVTCINCMMTQLFKPEDKRREAAFLWNYSGMNIGFFVGFTISGFYQLKGNYQQLFLLASFGNIIAFIITVAKWKLLTDVNTRFIASNRQDRFKAQIKGFFFMLFLVLLLHELMQHASVSNHLIIIVGVLMAFVIAYLGFIQRDKKQQQKIWAYLILALTALVFWTLYQLAPMGLNLFIERNVDRHYLGFLIAPQWVQNINTVVIIIGGPLLSVLFSFLRHRGIHFTIPLQFSIALFLIGVSMIILPIGIYYADTTGLINFNWILISYILQSAGELFISPIGYAMIGQLAPITHQGLMMGTWMMITGVAATFSGYFSQMALKATSTDPLITNPNFAHMFNLLGWAAIITSMILLVLIPFLLRLMNEKYFISK